MKKNDRVLARVCNVFNITSGLKETARLSAKHDKILDHVEIAEEALKKEMTPAMRKKIRQALKNAEVVLNDLRGQINEKLRQRK